jgi:hypothetical protein
MTRHQRGEVPVPVGAVDLTSPSGRVVEQQVVVFPPVILQAAITDQLVRQPVSLASRLRLPPSVV